MNFGNTEYDENLLTHAVLDRQRTTVADRQTDREIDMGCGSGVYLPDT
jgi:hypothetical protein